MNRYIFNKTYSGRRSRERLFRTTWLGSINWRTLGRCFTYAMAVIGMTLLVGVVGYLLALGGKLNQ